MARAVWGINGVTMKLAAAAVGLSVVTLAMGLLAEWDETKIASVISYVLLACGILALLHHRGSVVDATFFFLIFFTVYQVVNPFAYLTDITWVWKGSVLTDHWGLALRGNYWAILGLAAYALGLHLAGRRPLVLPESPNAGRWLDDTRLRRLLWALVIIAVLAWLVLFVFSDMPKEVFYGRSPGSRFRGLFYELPGHSYIMTLVFGINLAILCYVLLNPQRWLVAWPLLLFFYAVLVLNAFDGSRLILMMTPVAAFVMRELALDRRRPPGSGDQRALGWFFLIGGLLFLLAVLYGQYRVGRSVFEDGLEFNAETLWYLFNTFDTAITYFLVIDRVPLEIDYWYGMGVLVPFLVRIPSFVYPEKYEMMWNTQKFTMQFYGYNQYDPEQVSRGVSMMAELYLNFTSLGIIVACFALGWLNEKLSRRARSGRAGNLFLLGYVFYVVYAIPYAFKSGLIAMISYVDVRVIVLLLGLLLVFVTEPLIKRVWPRRE